MDVIVKDRQTLLDVAVQCLGGVESVFALAVRNNKSITETLIDGERLVWEPSDVCDLKVQNEYSAKGILPATDIDIKEYEALLDATSIRTELRRVPMVAQDVKPKIPVNKIDQIIADLENGKEVIPESKQPLTRIFDNPFDIVFA